MRNGFLSQHKNLIILFILAIVCSFIISEQVYAADNSEKVEIPLPQNITNYLSNHPQTNLEMIIEMDKMESKQDKALEELTKQIVNLTEKDSFNPDSFSKLENEFKLELEERRKEFNNPYIDLEGQRLFADFLLRLSLASLTIPKVSLRFLSLANSYANTVYAELLKRGSAWIEKETPQILSRLAVTKLSLLNVKRLHNPMTDPQFFASSRAIKDKILELKPNELSEAEILSAHLESLLFGQNNEALAPYAHFYMSVKEQDHLKESSHRLEILNQKLSSQKSGGLRRILAIEKSKTVLNIVKFYLVSPSELKDAFENLEAQLKTAKGLEKRSLLDAALYLYSVNEYSGLALPLAGLIGKTAEAKQNIQQFEAEFTKSFGENFVKLSSLPRFESIYTKLSPVTNTKNAHHLTWGIQEYIQSVHTLSEKFILRNKNKEAVSEDELQRVIESVDRRWADMQCMFVFNRIDTFNGQLIQKSPFTKMKFKFSNCLVAPSDKLVLNSLSYNLQVDQITRQKNLELTIMGVGFTIDVALAITTLGAGNAVKKGLQTVSLGACREITRKLVVHAAGRAAMKIAQSLAVAITTDIIVSVGRGIKSFTFEAIRGRMDLENLKDMPYFDKDIGPAKHLTRLFATTLAGFGMGRVWRAASATGFGSFLKSESTLQKLLAGYSTNTVNSTVSKLSSAVADIPYDGKAALKQVPEIFTFQNLVVGSFSSVTLKQFSGAVNGLSEHGMSSKFIIRLSDKKLSLADEEAVEEGLLKAN